MQRFLNVHVFENSENTIQNLQCIIRLHTDVVVVDLMGDRLGILPGGQELRAFSNVIGLLRCYA